MPHSANTRKLLVRDNWLGMKKDTNSSAQVECYQRAVRLDMYLAVAYFQQGVSNFLLGDFEEALANFNDTLLYLRGNTVIDYAQLGLLFKLYSCEVLFNRGLCYIYLQQKEAGMQDLNYAVKEKMVEDHNVIDEAIREEAEVGNFGSFSMCSSNNRLGLYGVFHTSRSSISAQRSQGSQLEDEGLSRQSSSSGCIGPVERIYRVRRIRDQERRKSRGQGRPSCRHPFICGDESRKARVIK